MPIPTKQYGKGRSGVAMVSITGDKVTVTFEDNGQTITCLLADSPSYIRQGRQAVTMNSSNTEIYGARPVGGTYRAVFAGFAAGENEPPKIREVAAKSGVSQSGKKYNIKAHLEFTALFDIVSGKWKDYRLVYNLNYGFERYDGEDPENPLTLVYGGKVADFLAVCGIDFETDTIPWSDNVLVFLEKVLTARKRQVAISLTDQGWVKAIGEIPEEDDEEEEPDEEEAPTKVDREKLAKDYEDTFGAPKPDEEPAKKKKQASAPTVLDIMFLQAQSGDQDAMRMLKALAASNPDAKEKLDELNAE